MISRRDFLKLSGAGVLSLYAATRGKFTLRAQFNTPGQFTWHCHIVSHEDNEIMRPYRIGPEQPGQPMSQSHGGM